MTRAKLQALETKLKQEQKARIKAEAEARSMAKNTLSVVAAFNRSRQQQTAKGAVQGGTKDSTTSRPEQQKAAQVSGEGTTKDSTLAHSSILHDSSSDEDSMDGEDMTSIPSDMSSLLDDLRSAATRPSVSSVSTNQENSLSRSMENTIESVAEKKVRSSSAESAAIAKSSSHTVLTPPLLNGEEAAGSNRTVLSPFLPPVAASAAREADVEGGIALSSSALSDDLFDEKSPSTVVPSAPPSKGRKLKIKPSWGVSRLLAAGLKRFALTPQCESADAYELWRELDADSDGKVTFMEFRSGMTKKLDEDCPTDTVLKRMYLDLQETISQALPSLTHTELDA
jgi:hypothetical protein